MSGDFWSKNAARLAADLASCTPEFNASASLEEVTKKTGAWFSSLSENVRAGVLGTLRCGKLESQSADTGTDK